jgi:cellulose synthase/poly-beta-1,6-N-acetylglucosamine synthase-like glycosyltransferase
MNGWALASLGLGVFWLVYVYIGYPTVLTVLGLVSRVRPVIRESGLPSVSVLIAARNEEKDIAWKIAETLAWNYPPHLLEILVASDASDDRTDEIVKGIRDDRITLERIEIRGGKCRALNVLAQRARGELLFFTDANSHIGPDCLRYMVRHFSDERVGCVTGDSHPFEEKERASIGDGASVYWGYESYLRRLESTLGSVLVCDGAIFCIRRELYIPLSSALANDLELPMLIGNLGYWVLHEPQAIVWEHDTSSPTEEFARRRRICAQGALGMWSLRSTMRGLRGWQFFSHKTLRWLTLIPMVLVFAGTVMLAETPAFALALIVQILFYLCAAAVGLLHRSGVSVGRLFSVPFYVVLGAWGALCGVWDACRQRRFDIWEIPMQSRGRGIALSTSEIKTSAMSLKK